MSALDRQALSEACRALYEMAGKDHILPPLTRQAGFVPSKPFHTYHVVGGLDRLALNVALDETSLRTRRGDAPHLPLRFDVRRFDGRTRTPAPLTDEDRMALVRAFLFGARAPISVEEGNDGRFRIALQLSSTYFVPCGVLPDSEEEQTPGDICRVVAGRLYEASADLFVDRASGVSVWLTRASQSLLGEVPPCAFQLWPESGEPPLPIERRPAIRPVVVATRAPISRQAVAASVAVGVIGLGGLAAACWPAAERVQRADTVAEATMQLPLRPDERLVASLPVTMPAIAHVMPAASAEAAASMPPREMPTETPRSEEAARPSSVPEATVRVADIASDYRPLQTMTDIVPQPLMPAANTKGALPSSMFVAHNVSRFGADVPLPPARPVTKSVRRQPTFPGLMKQAAVSLRGAVKGLGMVPVRLAAMMSGRSVGRRVARGPDPAGDVSLR